ncbi:MAG: hypothetical protein II707_08570 [Spirochaetales bacterium]|nr:hypothetical protein [Spirochaetales bacterium]
MVTADDIKKAVGDIQNHYNTNINNKYVKNSLLRMDVPLHVQQNKDFLLKGDLYYIDSRGAVEDLYMGVAATMDYIDMRVKHVMPHITFTGADFVAKDANERVMAQMALKNYGMNVEIFRKKVCDFFTLLTDYDMFLFNKNPAYKNIKNYENLKARCAEDFSIAEDK